MSTLTQAQPGTAVPARLLSVPLAVTFLAEFTSLTSFFLLLSVMPMLAAAAGAGSSACRADHRVPAARHRGGRGRGRGSDQAVRLPDGARGRSRAARRAGPGHARPRAPGRHGERQPGARASASACAAWSPARSPPSCCLPSGAVRGSACSASSPASRPIFALPAGVWLAGHHLAAAAAAMAAVAGLLPLVAIRWLPGGREARRTARARPERRAPAAPGGWRAPRCGCR